ncbi:hypothetical protein COCVIDRAFT_35530 [Bipolaris victoriae FI3]|uniref:Uncharacterized protein n=1 Tax=Bipolaris victoriae (strain FI3) TaxID=930091 RepID=W7ENU7_BIPV3|nr:hypothetical protein COCVIDRAFT_35530 [Bipolaris victoriae FI3]
MELEMTHNHIPGTNQIGNGDIRGDTVQSIVAITLPLTLMHKSTGASTNSESENPKPPTSFPLSPSTLDAPPEKPTTPASLYPLTSAIATALSSIASVTSPTPIPSPSPTSQPLAPAIQSPSPTRKEAITSYAAFLTPGALCTADAQCSPNICYTEPNTVTYCCGPTITGCPGWPCSDPGHRDCKDPFKCDFQAFTCSL